MDISEIEGRIRAIKESVGDYEAAHVLEDELRLDFIIALSNGECLDNIETMAALVASTKDIGFPRYCA